MSIELAQNNDYPVSFTAASLRPDLARIVAEAYLDCGDWEQAKQRTLTQNLLQARSRSSAIRMERELRQRLQTLTRQQLAILANAPADSRRAIAWLSVLKRVPFVFAFAVEVLRIKDAHLDRVLRLSDYEDFFATQAAGHPELAYLTASTQTKIRNVLFTMLREAGIAEESGKEHTFGRPVLPPEVLEAIVSDDPCWLAGFLVPDTEINSLARQRHV